MKTPTAIGLVAASVLITVAIEESRIQSLRTGMKAEEKAAVSQAVAAATPPAHPNTEAPAPPVRTKNRPELKPTEPAKAPETEDESLAKTARKMWDNPAGKSMMNQGVKMAVGMMYQDFIDSLDLGKDEAEYFKNLLGKDMAAQQEIGMKMLGATEEERTKLAEEITQRAKDNEEEIKKFLNNDEDYQKYTDYKNRLPERQQLDGIRATLSSKGVPLDAEAETKLMDAMYRVRTETKAPDFSGPGAMNELAKGNIVETFEKSWTAQQEALHTEAGKILNEAQMTAFQEYQKQAKEMQLMGLKMAEKMFPGKKDPSQ